MSSRRFWFFVPVVLLVLLATSAHAQEATISGLVTDSTGAVLPGVTVTAVHEASGNNVVVVTDDRGQFRLPVRVGSHRVTSELLGFTTATQSGLEVRVGQNPLLKLEMSPSSVQETVTVTGEAPLIDTTQSSLGTNIDPRQMSEIPLNGRNWIDLTSMAPGARQNALTEEPRGTGAVQLNVDGQQVTQNLTFGFGQQRFSRDAIAEFEFIANRFDATQGRSSGVQVNAVTKAGTNALSGTAAGYFRSDDFNAADFIARRVLPYSNQQLSFTLGGPVRRDRIHFFAHYEFEREPQTFTFNSPYPSFNIDLGRGSARTSHIAGGRVDVQFSPRVRLTGRVSAFNQKLPFDPRFTGGATFHPSGAVRGTRSSMSDTATLTHVLSSRTLNEVRGGYTDFQNNLNSVVTWSNHPQAAAGITEAFPIIALRGYTIGTNQQNMPQEIGQTNYFIRDDFTHSYNRGGSHTLKVGGEYLYGYYDLTVCRQCMGRLDAQNGPVPANVEALFPVWDDISTWNIAALSSITRAYTIGIGRFDFAVPRHTYAAWVQDDWTVGPRLTVNLGIRYDYMPGMFGEQYQLSPWLEPDRKSDTNDIAPRFGFAYSLNSRTVVRGGAGKFFGELNDAAAHGTLSWTQILSAEVLNDGRPDFAANPFNGPVPTFAQLEQRLCYVNRGPTCVRRGITQAIAGNGMQTPYTYQGSIGVQRQVGDVASIEANYVFNGSRAELVTRAMNLTYNPATGANYPFTDISRRLNPDWGTVAQTFTVGRSNAHELQTAFTRRFSQNWQLAGTYTLATIKSEEPPPPTPFPLAPDFGGEYTFAVGEQRHRAVINGIWQIGFGFQVSGLYFFGSGERFATTYGGDLRQQGIQPSNRLRPNGTIVPRNDFVGKPVHRIDTRLQRRFTLGGAQLDGMLEAFNLFNHENYGSYVTQESNARYGQPTANTNIAFAPRMIQLGMRFAF